MWNKWSFYSIFYKLNAFIEFNLLLKFSLEFSEPLFYFSETWENNAATHRQRQPSTWLLKPVFIKAWLTKIKPVSAIMFEAVRLLLLEPYFIIWISQCVFCGGAWTQNPHWLVKHMELPPFKIFIANVHLFAFRLIDESYFRNCLVKIWNCRPSNSS